MKIATCLLTITSLVLSACGGGGNDIEKAKSLATTEHLKRYTEAISHDSCQGRKPFSEGADRAVNYIARQMKEVGLIPINGDSYLQQYHILTYAMPEADGLEYPGRKDLIGLARGLYRFLRTDRAGDRYRQRGTGIRRLWDRSPRVWEK